MPRAVEIGVFNIARTEVDKAEVERWLNFIGVEDHNIPDDGAVSNPALLIALAAKRCYKSFEPNLNPNVSRIRRDYTEYLDNILASAHGAVLEHSVYTFSFENVSRVFTGEMNRHRAGWAISEGSMRYIRYDDIPFWLPTSLRGPDVLEFRGDDAAMSEIEADFRGGDLLGTLLAIAFQDIGPDDCDQELLASMTIDEKKQLSRIIFMDAFEYVEAQYKALQLVWVTELAPDSKFKEKKQITSMMRRIIPMGVATGGVWTGNLRALRHVIATRASDAAEEEILHVFTRVGKIMAEREPLIFGDFEETEEGYWIPKYPKV